VAYEIILIFQARLGPLQSGHQDPITKRKSRAKALLENPHPNPKFRVLI
jgi:hypothetical protein